MPRRPHLAIILALLPILLPALLNAAPVMRSCSLRQGTSLIKFADTTATFSWSVENPDDVQQTVVLQLSPVDTMADAIYSRTVVIPPHSRIEDSTEVIVCNASEYLMEMLQDGNRLYKDKIVMRLSYGRLLDVAILNDDHDLHGISKIRKAKNLPAQLTFTTFQVHNAPSHWSAFQMFNIVIVLRADFASYSTAQLCAIRDYTAHGGLLIIAASETPDLRDTILAELAPFTPAGSFTFDTLREAADAFGIQNYTPPPEYDKNGASAEPPRQKFLNFVPDPDCAVLLRQAGRPAIALARHGMGSILVLGFDPFTLSEQDVRFIPPVWSRLITCTDYALRTTVANRTARANRTLQLLQGYSIPPVSTILDILVLYIVGAVLILGVFFKLKRHSTGWLLLCLYGVVITALVMFRAGGIAKGRTDASVTSIVTTPWNGGQGPGEGNTILLSHKDMSPDIAADANNTFIRAQSNASSFTTTRTMPSNPIWLKSDGNIISSPKFTLQQLRPRTILWLANGADNLDNKASLPVLEFHPDGARMRDWPIPPQLADANRAILALNGTIRTIDISGRTAIDRKAASLLEADTALTSVIGYIEALNLRTPSLILVTHDETPDENTVPVTVTQPDASISYYNLSLTFIPLLFDNPQHAPLVENDLISFSIPDFSFLRTYRREGIWHGIPVQSAVTQKFHLNFHLLPELFRDNPSSITVAFDILATGGHTTFDARILTPSGQSIEPTSRHGNTFTFDTDDIKPMSPEIFGFKFELISSSKLPAKSGLSAITRTLFWKILDINATVRYRTSE